MNELKKNDLIKVHGGIDLLNGKDVGKAVGNYLQSVGKSISESAKDVIDAWLPIAEKINSALGAPGSK